VICVDEFGPLELRPQAGRSWQRRGKPARLRATYTRPHGVRHLLSYYDVGQDQLHGHFKPRKRSRDFLVFLKALRRRYRGPIWIVLDNLSAHRTGEVFAWAKANGVRLQFTPTNASWLNRIECEFTSLKKAALTHCDYASFDPMRRSIQKWIAWRNRRKARQLKLKWH
jgi:transposase